MTAGEPVGSYSRFQVNPADRSGRTIDPDVLRTMEELGHRLFEYGKKSIGDPAIIADLLEESGAAVSRVLRRSQGGTAAIRNIQAYLFRVFIRKINRVARQRPEFRKWDSPLSVDYRDSLEQKLILDEFIRSCDPRTREMLYRRLEGFSWKEIAMLHGMSAHAAESRCNQVVQRIRRKLGYRD